MGTPIFRQRLAYGLLVALVLGGLVVTLLIVGIKNPTPTNTSGGGPGSNYPGMQHGIVYVHPISGKGHDGS